MRHGTGAPVAASQNFGDDIDDPLAAARRDEILNAHARVIETAERELFTRAIQQAQGNQAKADRWCKPDAPSTARRPSVRSSRANADFLECGLYNWR